MKKAILLWLAAATLIACKTNDKKVTSDPIKDTTTAATPTNATGDAASFTSIQWLDSTYLDLGKQPEGKEIEMIFRFKNTGDKNLVIQNVTAQCGCTIPEKPEKPYAPGEEGVIKAKFNGSGHGEIRKEVYVTANTNPSGHVLTFHAELIK